MTKAEQRKMDRLERENVELRFKIANHMRIYGDLLCENATLKIALRQILESVDEVREVAK